MKRHVYHPGKVDYNRSGRKNCLAEFEWELTADGRFSLCSGIWNPRKTDYYCCGQNVEEVAAFFPHNKKVRRMLAIWRKYHLNDMRAGTPAQMAELERRSTEYPNDGKYYEWAKSVLAEAGLDPDPNYVHNGVPYRYGSAWIKEELPVEVIEEIRSWSAVGGKDENQVYEGRLDTIPEV